MGPRRRLTLALAVSTTLVVLGGPTSVASADPSPTHAPRTPSNPLPTESADDDSKPMPQDVLGRSSSSTVLRSDSLYLSGGTTTAPQVSNTWERFNPGMSDFADVTSSPKPTLVDSRTTLTPNVPTAAARPLDVDRDRVLSLKQSRAGDGAIWQVAADSSKIETAWRKNNRPATPVTVRAGTTYAITLGQWAVTTPTGSGGFRAPLAVTSAGDASSSWQQYTLRAAPGGGYRLVNQSDGLCVNLLDSDPSDGATIGTWPCDDLQATNANDVWDLAPSDNGSFTITNRASKKLLTLTSQDTVNHVAALGQRAAFSGVLGGLQQWTLTEIVQPGGVVPTWSTPASTTPGMPSAMVAGDLDRVTNADNHYGDETAVAFVGDDHRLQVRVLDYNANDSHIKATAPDQPLALVGGIQTTRKGNVWFPGSVGLAIGNFTGQALNDDATTSRPIQLAVTWQDLKGIHATFLTYQAAGSDRKLTIINPDVILVAPASTSAKDTFSLVAGASQTASGDFDGATSIDADGNATDDADDLAVSYETNGLFAGMAAVSFKQSNSGQVTVDQTTDRVSLVNDKSAGTLVPQDEDSIWMASGVRLVSGLFRVDNSKGSTIRQRQLAAIWQLFDGADKTVQAAAISIDPTFTATVSTPTNLIKNNYLTGPDPLPVLSATAGGFAGKGANANDSSTPAWGLAVASPWKKGTSSVGTGINVLRLGSDGAFAQTFSSYGGDGSQLTVQAYDQAGDSIILGAPVVMTSQQVRPTIIAAQPPAHSDWLNGSMVNVSRNPDYSTEFNNKTDEELTNLNATTTSSSVGVSEAFDSKTSVKEGLFNIESLGASLEISQKFDKEKELEKESTQGYSTLKTLTESRSTDDDDVVDGAVLTNYIYRYPIVGGPAKGSDGEPLTTDECPKACYAYYEVIVPSNTGMHGTDGKGDQYYQPTWQNGNALSYPRLDSAGRVHITDAGSYQEGSWQPDGSAKTGALFNGSNVVGGTSSKFELTLGTSSTLDTRRSSSGSLANSQEVAFGLNLKAKVGTTSIEQEFTASTGIDEKSTWANAQTTTNETKSESSYSVATPQIDSSRSYTAGSAVYFDKAGTQKVVHGVNLTGSAFGSAWWQRWYGAKPDLALNLPYATVMTKSDLERFTVPKWSYDDNRQQIRGFDVIHPQSSDDTQSAGDLYGANNPNAGDQVAFRVAVHNYSLKSSPSASASFYAIPVSPDKGVVVPGGTRQLIGQANVPAMGPQGMATIDSPTWKASVLPGTKLQNWRIYVVLDQGNAVDEVHELISSEQCPSDSINPPDNSDTDWFLSDTMSPDKNKPELLACGQNNQGYGPVAVSNAADAVPKLRAGLHSVMSTEAPAVESVRFTTGSGSDAEVKDGIVQGVVGQQLQGLIHVAASESSNEISSVMVYEGDPDSQNSVAHVKISGVDRNAGGSGVFSWRPMKPGVQELHATLITASGERVYKSATFNIAPHAAARKLVLQSPGTPVRTGAPVKTATKTADAYGNVISDVTRPASYSIAPEGWCRSGVCVANKPGPHTITASYGSMTATSTFTATKLTVTKVKTVRLTAPTAKSGRAMSVEALDQQRRPVVGAKVRLHVTSGPARFGAKKSITVTTGTDGKVSALLDQPISAKGRRSVIKAKADKARSRITIRSR